MAIWTCFSTSGCRCSCVGFGCYSDRNPHRKKTNGDPQSGQQLFGYMHNRLSQGDIYARGSIRAILPPAPIADTVTEPFQRNARPCAKAFRSSALHVSIYSEEKRQISLLPSVFTKCKYISPRTKMAKNKSSQMKVELHETNDINKSISAGLPVQKKGKHQQLQKKKKKIPHDPKNKLE